MYTGRNPFVVVPTMRGGVAAAGGSVGEGGVWAEAADAREEGAPPPA
jgi:hypothetical protein